MVLSLVQVNVQLFLEVLFASHLHPQLRFLHSCVVKNINRLASFRTVEQLLFCEIVFLCGIQTGFSGWAFSSLKLAY